MNIIEVEGNALLVVVALLIFICLIANLILEDKQWWIDYYKKEVEHYRKLLFERYGIK